MEQATIFQRLYLTSFTIKTGCLLAFWFCLSNPAHAILKKWTSTSSSDWNNAANWTPAGVPTAADSVQIWFADVDPVINSGVTAHVKNVSIHMSILTVNAGGSLVAEGNYFTYGLVVTSGTVANSGTILIKRGFNGLNVGYNGVFSNSATLNVGEATAVPYSFVEEAIRMTDNGNFVNNASGSITILRPGNNGILVFSTSAAFTNYGTITVNTTGLYPPVANTADGIDTRGAFTNETTGNISLINIGANGFVAKGGGSLNNKGSLSINDVGNTAGTDDQHGIWGDGSLTNSGSITINNAPRNGIIQLSNTFNNSGSILMGNSGTIGNYALVVGPNGGLFNNLNNGNVTVKSSAKGGILVVGFGASTLTNFAGGTINIDNVAEDGLVNFFSIVDNRGALNIGTVANIGRYGILNHAAFGNQFSGNIVVKNAATACIANADNPSTAGLVIPTITNTGIISTGASGGTVPGIENLSPSQFTNHPCGQITTWQRIHNTGTFTNNALLVCNNTSSHTNTGTFTNNGVLSDPNNTFGTVAFTNNDLWIRPKAACPGQPMSPALSIGGANSFTVSSTWMNGGSSAGTYVQASNTFTPSASLSPGNYTFTFSATGGGCTFQVSIPMQIASPPDVNVTSTNGLNYICPGGTITLQANVTSSTGTPSYLWSNGGTSSSTTVAATGTYSVTVTQSTGGCTDVASFTVIADPVAPVAKCVSSLTVNLSSPTITASQANNGSSDNCGITSMTLSQSSFTCANVGTNTVTLTVKDANNNVHTCTTTVNVVDNIAPTAFCQNVTVQLDASGAGSTSAAAVNNNSSDNCGIASMTLSQSSFSCANAGANTVTLTVKDAANNSHTCTATVNVEDNAAPTARCQNVTVQLDADGAGSTTAAAVDNNSSDACGIASMSLSDTEFGCEEVGNQEVTLTVTDLYGNSATCSATVTVEDNVEPEAGCQNLTATLDVETGEVSITPEEVDNGSNDACGIASLSLDETTFTCADLGENTVTLTVTDNHENTSTCEATLTVLQYDFSVSLPACQTVYFGYAPAACANINSTVSGGNAPYGYSWSSGQSTANIQYCATSPASPGLFNLVVTDENGCTASASASIQVVDVRCGNNLNKVEICHNGGNTQCVSPNAVAAHLAHGDYLGECGAPDPCEGSQALAVPLDNAQPAHTQPAAQGTLQSLNEFDEGSEEELNDFTVFPNPARQKVSITLKSNAGKTATVQIINSQGVVVEVWQFEALPAELIELDLHEFKSGLYWLNVQVEGKRSRSVKLVVAVE